MIYAVIERGPDAGTASSFETWDAYHAATFRPYSTSAAAAVFSVPAFIPGRNYRERKHSAENALHRAERIMETPGLSWGELAEIKAECERIARRAGLLREARENGIC